MPQKSTAEKVKRKSQRVKIPLETQLRLWVHAGGRCEFYGCNEDLLIDSLTFSETNYANIAHIVAANPEGPRGDDPLPLGERSKIENLMLACRKHHALIDSKEHVSDYPKDRLIRFKQEHEERISWVTGFQPHHKTTIIRLQANIGAQAVKIPFEHVREAILPRYPADPQGIDIDLTHLRSESTDEYWRLAANEIRERLKDLHTPGMSRTPVDHVSVFALAPIPLLVHLGSILSNKVPADLYQRHRDGENWKWRENGRPAIYISKRIHEGIDLARVGLAVALSGPISEQDIPAHIRDSCSIYEITLQNQVPNPNVLRGTDDLERFRSQYHELLAEIMRDRPQMSEIHLFPAVPAPIAIMCGRELLPKVHPALQVYDFDKSTNGFKLTLKVN